MNKWQWFKRAFDLCFSIPAILILLPIWLILALCIYFEDRGPILFRQVRPGKEGKLFTIYKFRSMTVNNIPPIDLGAVKHDHALVTHVGYLLRRLKLDETPQFINVLRGEMGLVGPRPCLPSRLEKMSPYELTRFKCLPGLTGWAEVNGNVELSWEEQLLLDLWYIEHWSFWLDLKIMFKTLLVVLFGSKKNAFTLLAAKKNYLSKCRSA